MKVFFFLSVMFVMKGLTLVCIQTKLSLGIVICMSSCFVVKPITVATGIGQSIDAFID